MGERSKDFAALVGDPDASVAVDFAPEGSSLLVAFGGVAGALGMPPFEFFNTATALPCKKIFVRDLRQAWYHGGMAGVGDSLGAIADHLGARIRESGATRTVFVGNSMGGYAALLFGTLLRPDAIHAFSPQTFIDRWQRLRHWDRRWSKQMRGVYGARSREPGYFDLRPVLERAEGMVVPHVHYCESDRLDTVHARRMEGLVTLSAYPTGGHSVIRHLRDSGLLRKFITEALAV
jgi:hypothetical protein